MDFRSLLPHWPQGIGLCLAGPHIRFKTLRYVTSPLGTSSALGGDDEIVPENMEPAEKGSIEADQDSETLLDLTS